MTDVTLLVRAGQVVPANDQPVIHGGAVAVAGEKEKALGQAMDELKHHVIRYYEGWPKKVEPEPYFVVNSWTDGKIQ